MIAQARSITEAAGILGMDKSRVSRILSSLEAMLNVELASRSSRHFQLTANGRKLFEVTHVQLAGIEQALQNFAESQSVPEGHVRLTVAHGLGTEAIPGALSEFMNLYPRVSVELIVSQEVVDLSKSGIDVAVRVGALPNSQLKSRKAGHARMIFVGSPARLKSRKSLAHPRDLADAPIVGLSGYSKNGVDVKSVRGEKYHLPGDYHFHSNSPALAVAMARGGQGIGFLPEILCRRALAAGELEHALTDWSGPSLVFNIVHRYHAKPPLHVRKLCDFLSEKFSALLQYGGAPF